MATCVFNLRLEPEFLQRPRAAFVLVTRVKDRDPPARRNWGRLEKFGLRPEKDKMHVESGIMKFFMFSDSISQHSLPLMNGDEVQFTLKHYEDCEKKTQGLKVPK